LFNGASVDSIVWDLVGSTTSVLTSDSLPEVPPVLGSYSPISPGLVISGRDADNPQHTYRVRAVVDEIFLCQQQPSSPTDAGPGETTPVVATRLASAVFPNPARGVAHIQYTAPLAATAAEIEIFTANGRLVRRIVDRMPIAGWRQTVWDGRDERGRPLARGLYFYRVTTAGGEATGKLVLLR
jgi:hypothetical protein